MASYWETDPSTPRNYKLCLIGNMGVGKTSLFESFRGINPCDPLKYRPTLESSYLYKKIETDEGLTGLMIWDTAGSERFNSVSQLTVRDASCCLLTFSLTERESFDRVVSYWWPKVQNWCPTTRALLVGNKLDCKERDVSALEIKNFCNEERMRYIETSALSTQNVDKCLHLASRESKRTRTTRHEIPFMESFKLYDLREEKDKNSCCAGFKKE